MAGSAHGSSLYSWGGSVALSLHLSIIPHLPQSGSFEAFSSSPLLSSLPPGFFYLISQILPIYGSGPLQTHKQCICTFWFVFYFFFSKGSVYLHEGCFQPPLRLYEVEVVLSEASVTFPKQSKTGKACNVQRVARREGPGPLLK